jgi:hypothetical protein
MNLSPASGAPGSFSLQIKCASLASLGSHPGIRPELQEIIQLVETLGAQPGLRGPAEHRWDRLVSQQQDLCNQEDSEQTVLATEGPISLI